VTLVIQRFGIVGVFLLMVPESACIPVPSEVTLLFSGFAASEHWLSLPLAIVAATAGNLVGSLLAYAVGRTGLPQRVPGVRALVDRFGRLLDDHPIRSVFVARLLPLARTFVSLPAGARRVPLLPFVAMTTLGCALWATGFVLLGLAYGTAWGAISSLVGKALLGAGVFVVAVAALRGGARRRLN
jgi:membrane protein DedA with SNARE-associated domain